MQDKVVLVMDFAGGTAVAGALKATAAAPAKANMLIFIVSTLC